MEISMTTTAERNMPEEIKTIIDNMKRRRFDAKYAETREEAKNIIIDMIPENWIIGCGDSTSLRSIGVIEALQDMGHYVLNPFTFIKNPRPKIGRLPLTSMKLTAQACHVFLSSSNAVTLDGRLVNVDGGGMRVTGQVFGPRISIFVIGRNKIVRNIDDAFWRIKNIIAPVHQRTYSKEQPPESYLPINPEKCIAELRKLSPERWGLDVPEQTSTGSITVILESKPLGTEIEIVPIIVNEDLGLGWDPSWPQDRKDRIFLEYQSYTPPHRPLKDRKIDV
jgi:hypothetical protein